MIFGAGVDAGSSDVVNEHSAVGSAVVDADGGKGVDEGGSVVVNTGGGAGVDTGAVVDGGSTSSRISCPSSIN